MTPTTRTLRPSMGTDELIHRLSQDARALPPRSPRLLFSTLAWSALALGTLALVVELFLGPRGDLASAVNEPRFVASLCALAVVALAAAYCGLVSGIPGKRLSPGLLLVLRIALAAFFLAAGSYVARGGFSHALGSGLDPAGAHCSMIVLQLSVLPGAALLVMLRSLAPTHPGFSGWMVGLAMGAMGAFGICFVCPVEHPVHQMLWHGLPVLLLAFAGSAVARRLLRW